MVIPMKLHIRIFSFVLLSINSYETICQTDNKNHQKYWYYKSRLNNDFVKVGRLAGESIPFRQRSSGTSNINTSNVDMVSGDGMALVGQYIAVLATEYKLLKDKK